MTDARYSKISGWGFYVPEGRLTNSMLSERLGKDETWITSRTGVAERRIAAPHESTSTMATRAAEAALRRAGLEAVEIDQIFLCTLTPDHACPPTSAIVQHALGAGRAGAIDLNATCTGFIYALTLADHFIRGGGARHVLVIAAETLSRITNPKDVGTSVLFGDGAGAVVVSATDRPGGLKSSVLGSDGSGAAHLIAPAGGSKRPTTHETVEKGEHLLQMNGRAVYRFAVTIIPQILMQAVSDAGLELSDLDLVVPHQANSRILEEAFRDIPVAPGIVFQNVERYGNTSSASLPIALAEALDERGGDPGRYLSLVGFGAGLTWGSLVWEWQRD